MEIVIIILISFGFFVWYLMDSKDNPVKKPPKISKEEKAQKIKTSFITTLREDLIQSFIENARKYNLEQGLDFSRKENIITARIIEAVTKVFYQITTDEDFIKITLEDIENCNKDLLYSHLSLYINVLSAQALAITMYYSLDLEVMQPTTNYERNIDIIMDFISESIRDPKFDNFTTNDIKNYLKNKFNQIED